MGSNICPALSRCAGSLGIVPGHIFATTESKAHKLTNSSPVSDWPKGMRCSRRSEVKRVLVCSLSGWETTNSTPENPRVCCLEFQGGSNVGINTYLLPNLLYLRLREMIST